ncbi:MAG: hypothetical protein AB1558_03275 [Thermodesulfobacteriota bacterium]
MKIKMFRPQQAFTPHPRPSLASPVLCLMVALALMLACPPDGSSRDRPAKTITLIIPWPAGGGTDVAGRILAPRLSRAPGVPVQTVKESLSDPEVVTKLDKLGIEPFCQPGDRYKQFVLEEGEAIRALKLR